MPDEFDLLLMSQMQQCAPELMMLSLQAMWSLPITATGFFWAFARPVRHDTRRRYVRVDPHDQLRIPRPIAIDGERALFA